MPDSCSMRRLAMQWWQSRNRMDVAVPAMIISKKGQIRGFATCMPPADLSPWPGL